MIFKTEDEAVAIKEDFYTNMLLDEPEFDINKKEESFDFEGCFSQVSDDGLYKSLIGFLYLYLHKLYF